MKYLLLTLSANLVALTCIAVTGCLAVQGKDDWGWFLIAGVICTCSMEFRDKE